MPEQLRYADVLKPRAEVLEDKGLLDMVNLAAIAEAPGKKRRGLAAQLPGQDVLRDPEAFFALTYPTEDVRQTLTALSRRASSPERIKDIMRGFGSGSWYDLTLGFSRRDRRYPSTCA